MGGHHHSSSSTTVAAPNTDTGGQSITEKNNVVQAVNVRAGSTANFLLLNLQDLNAIQR